jgi:DNA-binding transcriptional MerR regulator/quercetin dioxygenase-like cupin family protein
MTRRRAPAATNGRFGFLTVGQTARILGVSPSTLRLWENVGLIAPVRSDGRYRLYSPELLQVLKRIKYLRDVKQLNVPGIKDALNGGSGRSGGSRSGGSGGSSSAPTPDLGAKLRKLRQRTGLGVNAAARQAKISPGFLSAIERARSNASVATLQRLAAAYGTTVIELFQSKPKKPTRLVRPGQTQVLQTHSGVRMELLASGTTMLQCMLFRVGPGAGSDGAYSHQGEEFLYMLEGSLEMWLDEIECHELVAGDSFWFESTLGHRWYNPGKCDALLLWINTPPTF